MAADQHVDTGIGVFAFADGATTLTQARRGAVDDFGTACQTFGLGQRKIGLAMSTQNPLCWPAASRIFSRDCVVLGDISVYVDPLDMLGAAGTSALLGLGIALRIGSSGPGQLHAHAVRSGAVALCIPYLRHSASEQWGFIGLPPGKALASTRHRSQVRLTVDDIHSGCWSKRCAPATHSSVTFSKRLHRDG